MAWIGFAEEDEAKRVRPVAWTGHEDGYLGAISVTWADEAQGQGPVGIAIRMATPRVVQHIATDPSFAPWRVEAIRRGYEGTGLGLSIVRGLVEEQPGASIEVQSRPGEGTTFILALPVANAAPVE